MPQGSWASLAKIVESKKLPGLMSLVSVQSIAARLSCSLFHMLSLVTHRRQQQRTKIILSPLLAVDPCLNLFHILTNVDQIDSVSGKHFPPPEVLSDITLSFSLSIIALNKNHLHLRSLCYNGLSKPHHQVSSTVL